MLLHIKRSHLWWFSYLVECLMNSSLWGYFGHIQMVGKPRAELGGDYISHVALEYLGMSRKSWRAYWENNSLHGWKEGCCWAGAKFFFGVVEVMVVLVVVVVVVVVVAGDVLGVQVQYYKVQNNSLFNLTFCFVF